MKTLLSAPDSIGYVSQGDIVREARSVAKSSAQERGFKSGKVAFWAIAPSSRPNQVTLIVQVTASNPDGNFTQYPVRVAM